MRLHTGLGVEDLAVARAGVAPVGDVEPLRHLDGAHVADLVAEVVVARLGGGKVEDGGADAKQEGSARLAELMDHQAEEALGDALRGVAGDGDGCGGPARGAGEYVVGTPASAQNSSFSTLSSGCTRGLTGSL